MNKKGNNIDKVTLINQEWINELSEDPELIPLILVYKPFTDEYWKQKYRILWYNLEPGGYIENDNDKTLKSTSFKRLLDKRNQTLLNTSLFIYCLYNKLDGIEIDDNQRKAARKNSDLLMEYMNKVTYMNLLKDTGESDFNNKYFWKFFNTTVYPKNRERTIDINTALDPDIIIVTGDDGNKLFQQLYNKEFDKKDFTFIHNNTLFLSIAHPSPRSGCWNDNYITSNINIIIEKMKQHNLL